MSRLTESDLKTAINELLPSFNPTGSVEKLSGGNINHVWRVHGSKSSVIAKHAPPFIASNPDIPLGSERLEFEAKALSLFGVEGRLAEVANKDCRPPKLLGFNADLSLLLMEDIGNYSELDYLDFNELSIRTIGKKLGSFIGSLHKITSGDVNLKESFHNAEIQRVRYQIQYQSAYKYAGSDDQQLTDQIKDKSQSLGKSLMEAETGICLLMGDLWPRSVFIDEHKSIRLIDWEFVHFGRPLQDIGHFAAHCWMQGQYQHYKSGINQWKKLWRAFLSGYKTSTGSEYKNLIDSKELGEIGVHIGTEILVRASGPFKKGYLYESFEEENPIVKDAIQTGIEFILDPVLVADYFEFR